MGKGTASRWWPRTVALALCIGAYWGASGLLRFHEVFFSPTATTAAPQRDIGTESPTTTRQYDRLVVVLIDAMRADMVLGSQALYSAVTKDHDAPHELSRHMAFTQSLLASGTAAAYVAHASVPTVTMPRLKALLSGKPPAFIDILKNFNSVALADENVIQIMRENDFRIVFYGDDTWLKLFPGAFTRSEGTSGFYTRDTVEVDTNVTRHLRDELDPTLQHPKSRDWDVLVLHYLGLDHVGHLRGPRSSMMADKLHEMDVVIQLVYESVRQQDTARRDQAKDVKPTLIVLCSDHGMSEIGNHGGATVEESSALMAFMRGDGQPFQEHDDVKQPERRLQVDLVPTIATLFGLRIPLFSTGRLLDRVMRTPSIGSPESNASELLKALHSNFLQLHQLAQLKFPEAVTNPRVKDLVHRVHQRVATDSGTENDDEELVQMLTSACQELQEKVARSDGSEYDTILTTTGVALLLTCGGVASHFAYRSVRQERVDSSRVVTLVTLSAFVATIVSLSSTSSIENEHATVFFVATTFLVAMMIDAATRMPQLAQLMHLLASLVCVRLLRERSQVINFARLNDIAVDTSLPGNEFAADDSLSVWFTGPLFEFPQLPQVVYFAIMYFALVGGSLYRWKVESFKCTWRSGALPIYTVGMICNVWCTQLIASDGSTEDIDLAARCVYGSAAILLILAASSRGKIALPGFEMALWLVTLMVQKSSNLPSLAVLCILLQLLSSVFRTQGQHVRTPFVGLFAVWMGSAAFFALGNSHLVTTIDISQSYHGLQDYSQSLVGALTFINTFSGPLVVFTRATTWAVLGKEKSCPNWTTVSMWIVLSYQAFRMAFFTIIVYFMRFHLFIWSVFAPKMLYEVVFSVVVAIFAAAI